MNTVGASGPSRLANLLFALVFCSATAVAQPSPDEQLVDATELIRALTDGSENSIPLELLQRARGIAVVPNVFRGGFILGARRGRGVFSLRMDDGSWSNPAFITLTGGSIGWQIGAESTDIVLIFANDNAVRNIASGKFTLGGEATAVAGPLRKQASSTMTFRAEVYGYLRSRGLYAGAAFQGARLNVDDEIGNRFYSGLPGAEALGRQSNATPDQARRFLLALDQTAGVQVPAPTSVSQDGGSETRTFPLPD
jgi:lipid-binding SYLF domain-containing protein